MRRSKISFAFLLLIPTALAQNNGLRISEPKVYDDYALEQMLRRAEASLANLELITGQRVTAAVGSLQGANVSQTHFSLSASGPPTQQIIETQSATPSTVTTTGSVAPSIPALATGTSQFALPAAFSPSSLDIMQELVQLGLEATNLRLLLRGSLTDQMAFDGRNLAPKVRATYGFPVTIETPDERKYRDAVAEVLVTITINGACRIVNEGPGLKMVLPRERTYNVAQITNKTTSLGGGLVAGVINLGGNWLRGRSKQFLVRDQDTIAFERSADMNEIVFGWRFKPVLGQRTVQTGLRQVFAQLTFPSYRRASEFGQAMVKTRWRRFDRKTGALGNLIANTDRDFGPFPIRNYDQSPGNVRLRFLDLGGGRVRVELRPLFYFFEGTTFRLGGTASRVELSENADHVSLDVSALELVRQGLFMGLRGQQEREVNSACSDVGLPGPTNAACVPIPAQQSDLNRQALVARARAANPRTAVAVAEALCGDRFAFFRITNIRRNPLGESRTRLQITLDKLRRPIELPFLTIIGDKVFGLSDAPYDLYDPVNNVIELTVSNSLLEKANTVEVVRLMWGDDYHASYPLVTPASLKVSKQIIISLGNDLLIALQGRGLAGVRVIQPPSSTVLSSEAAYALISIPKSQLKGLKQMIVRGTAGLPVFVDVSKSATVDEKPQLQPIEPIKVGTGVKLTVKWKNKATLKAVKHGKTPQVINAKTDTSVNFTLNNNLTGRPGKVTLSFEFEGNTKLPYTVRIVDQQISVLDQK